MISISGTLITAAIGAIGFFSFSTFVFVYNSSIKLEKIDKMLQKQNTSDDIKKIKEKIHAIQYDIEKIEKQIGKNTTYTTDCLRILEDNVIINLKETKETIKNIENKVDNFELELDEEGIKEIKQTVDDCNNRLFWRIACTPFNVK